MKNNSNIQKRAGNELHKGYNEKNITEEQGAFKPDHKKDKKNKIAATSPIVEKNNTEKANQ
jgi:hypothetical protein